MIWLERQKLKRILWTCFSSSLLTNGRNEIGQYLEGVEDGGKDLWIGTIEEDFHSWRKRPVVRLKMWVKGSAIDGEVALSMHEETKSGPVAVLGGRVEMREAIDCSEHRKDAGHIGGGEIGGRGLKER